VTGGKGMPQYTVVEVCAGAGGQALGLELAGFRHEVVVEVDPAACATLRANRPGWHIAEGDVTSAATWDPGAYKGVDLLAGGVPCQPFSVGGRQLGAGDERDLFYWTVQNLAAVIAPRAIMLENVPGLSQARFAAYRQRVLDRLAELGYAADWRLLNACDHGVSQLRPRLILVAMRPEDFACFTWPEPQAPPPSVGEALLGLMSARGWPGAAAWAAGPAGRAIAPTIVGGSKKHGGPDLGPTRAKRAWRALGVDGRGIADEPPGESAPDDLLPRLTCTMTSALQGWTGGDYRWAFPGRKTPVYRQIGNAFPPPVARAVGGRLRAALDRQGQGGDVRDDAAGRDQVHAVLRADGGFLTVAGIRRRLGQPVDAAAVERHVACLASHVVIDVERRPDGDAYRLSPACGAAGEDERLGQEEAARRLARRRPRRAPALPGALARRAG
jgi:DNA (cytosine-5)-methyltransferase 1